MKRYAILLFVLALTPIVALAQSYSAVLSGAAEVPGPGDPDGSGLGVVTIDGTTVRYNVWAQGIGAPTQAHIHAGAPGIAGGPVVTLDVNMLANGSTTVTADVANQIKANPAGFYVNVHNAEFPGGALRGQLVASHETQGSMTAFIPVVGKVRGQANTNFVTDLRIINEGGSTANVTLDFFTQSAAGHSAPTSSKQVTVAPGEQKVLNDVVGVTLGVDGVLGGLRITSDQNVIASARVINDLRSTGNGTAGFAVDAEAGPGSAGTISFLHQNADFRTNLGYFNPGPAPVTATFTARRASNGAVLGTVTSTIPGYAMVQQAAFGLVSSVAAADQVQDDFYVTWSASAPLFVYGAVTDFKTGDAVLNR
ncbi:MAG: CHRD domain-containing protein [Thermoanaerobaculia bacterium]